MSKGMTEPETRKKPATRKPTTAAKPASPAKPVTRKPASPAKPVTRKPESPAKPATAGKPAARKPATRKPATAAKPATGGGVFSSCFGKGSPAAKKIESRIDCKAAWATAVFQVFNDMYKSPRMLELAIANPAEYEANFIGDLLNKLARRGCYEYYKDKLSSMNVFDELSEHYWFHEYLEARFKPDGAQSYDVEGITAVFPSAMAGIECGYEKIKAYVVNE